MMTTIDWVLWGPFLLGVAAGIFVRGSFAWRDYQRGYQDGAREYAEEMCRGAATGGLSGIE